MTEVLITGVKGFLGRNLGARLIAQGECRVTGVDVGTAETVLREALRGCDIVFHLAGVNRPTKPSGFKEGNRDFTAHLCGVLRSLGRAPGIVFSSSSQAALDNAYGISKREAEEILLRFGAECGAAVRIYRLKNVFGKWCRPNYNSVVATFCHSIANDLPIRISDPGRELELVYVDDVIAAFLSELPGQAGLNGQGAIPSYKLTLGDLAGRIQAFHDMRTSLVTPDFSVPFNQQLYATYLSYVPEQQCCRRLEVRSDQRGALAEFIKSPHFGQIFVSRTGPGITRGNHYHHTKTEKFFVVEGEAVIRMRQIESSEVVEYRVRGEDFQVIDIPPGYTHSIENAGTGEMVALFWASEIFDPDRPDTWYLPVLLPAASGKPVHA